MPPAQKNFGARDVLSRAPNQTTALGEAYAPTLIIFWPIMRPKVTAGVTMLPLV